MDEEEQKQKTVKSEDKYKRIDRVLKKVYKAVIIVTLIISAGLMLFFNPSWPFLKENRCSLYVRSNPDGAAVYINGHDIHKTTPCEISMLHPGSYDVSISKSGYSNKFDTKVNLEHGFCKVVYADLTKKEVSSNEFSNLQIDTDPKGATIEVNGIVEGTSPLNMQVKEGKYNIFVEPFKNFIPVFKSISVEGGETTHITLELKEFQKDTSFKWNSYNVSLPSQAYKNIGAKKIFVSPFNPNVMFLSVGFTFDNIIYKSTDSGRHWNISKTLQIKEEAYNISFSHNNPLLIYAMPSGQNLFCDAYSDKLYKSTDLGKTWQCLNLPYGVYVCRFTISPANDNVLYLSGYDKNNSPLFLISLNGGRNWENVKDLPKNFQIKDFEIFENNPEIIYALGEGKNLFAKSTDSGKTWKPIRSVLDHTYPDMRWQRIHINPSNSNEIYIYGSYSVEDKDSKNSNQEDIVVLYHSTDDGKHFKEVSWPFKENYGLLTFVIAEDGTLYMSNYGENILVLKDGKSKRITIDKNVRELYFPNFRKEFPYVRTFDNYREGIGCSSYKIVDNKIVSLDNLVYNLGFFSIAYPHFSGKDGKELYAIVGNKYLMESNDLGKHWYVMYTIPDSTNNLEASPPPFAVCNDKFYILTGKTLLVSKDYGKHFDIIALGKGIEKIGNSIWWSQSHLIVNPADENNIIIYDDENLLISNDGGKSFKDIYVENKSIKIGSLYKVDIINNNGNIIIYALTYKGLYKSIDKGNSWEKLSISFYTDYSNPAAFTILPGKKPSIIVMTANKILYKSTDFGKTFNLISLNFYSKNTASYGKTRFFYDSNNILYLIIPSSGIYESKDKGYTWMNINNNLKDYFTNITRGIGLLYYATTLPSKSQPVFVISSFVYGLLAGEQER